jgi:hypothetical protein
MDLLVERWVSLSWAQSLTGTIGSSFGLRGLEEVLTNRRSLGRDPDGSS